MGLKVTDIQDKNSQTREIQDKDWANRTSQNTINSSDFVLLEDTNGAYHKINRTSFADAVRDVLGSSINSAAKGTDIAKLPVLDSNNDLGMGTLANVASVLGAYQLVSSIDLTNTSASTYPQKGKIYYIANSNNITGAPSGITALASCIVRVNPSNSGYLSQIIQELQGEGNIWVRDVLAANISVNTNWIRVTPPAFYKNYSDLSSLASALGVPTSLGYIKNSQFGNNVDDFKNTKRIICGMTDLDTTHLPSNVPSGDHLGFVIFIPCGSALFPDFGIQMWFNMEMKFAFSRVMWNTWTSWIQLA